MEEISIHKTSIQLLTLKNTSSSLPAFHSAGRACPSCRIHCSKSKETFSLGRRRRVRTDEGGKKEIFPTLAHLPRLTHIVPRRRGILSGMTNEKWNQEGVTPRSLSFLLLSNSMVKRRRIETTTSKVATARMVGLICSRIPENICQGMVRWR